MPNRLINESSPYLLQHANNPVDWYPWGPEALQKAQSEDKPILVSIGYSACHWCHVMEHESFENQQIADIMNEYFICIKVDREERPDVDAIYMDSLHAMGVRGGWPLNVFLMPDAKPFYGGTYFPIQKWGNLLMSIQNAFVNNRIQLQNSADGFAQNLQLKESDKYNFGEIDKENNWTDEDLIRIFNNLQKDFDTQKGGMNRAPKFPMPAIWVFLLRYYERTKDERAFKQLKLTLDRIAIGGIYDTLGGGWTRYSTDDEWKVPHFEKMLYDNGQLVSLYSEAYALTKDELYKQKVEETIAWLEREMTSSEGGFYSAQDADSEGEEGKFYVWGMDEVQSILKENADEFFDFFDFVEEGNWEHGNNVVHYDIRKPITPTLLASIQKLFEVRQQRVRPGLDDKILCSWNALMLKGLVDAYRYIGHENFLTLAIKNAQFIKEKMMIIVSDEDGNSARGLWHNYKAGKATIVAYLEDYAAVIDAFTALYQVTFDETWLRDAEMLANYTLANFFDSEEEFFYFTDIQGEKLIARKKELFDNVVPASNSIMANNLFKLGLLLGRTDFMEISNAMLAKMKNLVIAEPQWVMNWASLATYHTSPTAEVALVGERISEVRAVLDADFQPNKIFIGTKTASDLPLLQNRNTINNETTIYVCFDKTCQLPTTDVEKALELLQGNF